MPIIAFIVNIPFLIYQPFPLSPITTHFPLPSSLSPTRKEGFRKVGGSCRLFIPIFPSKFVYEILWWCRKGRWGGGGLGDLSSPPPGGGCPPGQYKVWNRTLKLQKRRCLEKNQYLIFRIKLTHTHTTLSTNISQYLVKLNPLLSLTSFLLPSYLEF